ncbi:LysR substrate-binding domain-containing protein [Okibacterium endophyticum]
MHETDDLQRETLRVAFVPGVTLARWSRAWAERMPAVALDILPTAEAEQAAALHNGTADVSFVRLPVDRDGLHVIPLYNEKPVVVVPGEHPFVLFDEVPAEELAHETMLPETDAWASVGGDLALAVELVAAGTGLLELPMSLARLHHRRDVEYRVVTDRPETTIALAWRADDESPLIEEWIGVVRGRTPRSSRGTAPEASAPQPAPAKSGPPNTPASGGRAPTANRGRHAKAPGKRPRPKRRRGR